jgi:hypothetical protein
VPIGQDRFQFDPSGSELLFVHHDRGLICRHRVTPYWSVAAAAQSYWCCDPQDVASNGHLTKNSGSDKPNIAAYDGVFLSLEGEVYG